MARRPKKPKLGIRERYVKGELTDSDDKFISKMLGDVDRSGQGAIDRTVLTAHHDIYRWFGVIEDRSYDGDSGRAWLDQAFGDHDPDANWRLWGVNADEIKGGTAASKRRGRKARDAVHELVGGRGVLFKSHKMRPNTEGSFKPGTGKYGRYLFEVIAIGPDGELFNLNQFLVEEELAPMELYGDRFSGWANP